MLSERAILVCLSLGLPPMAKIDKRITRKNEQDHGTAAGRLKTTKRLLPDQALKPVQELDREIEEYHRKNTCAWGEGERILNSAIYLEFSDRLRQFRMRRETLVEEFVRNYLLYVDEARRQLNGAFDPRDYLPQERIASRFTLKVEYKPVPDAGDFRVTIVREAMDELRESVNRRVEEAERGIRRDIASRIAKPLAHMVNRLNDPDADFRDSLVGNLREICDLIPKLNMLGDPQVEATRQQIYADLYRADTGLLKENRIVRGDTARKAQDILDKMQDYFGAEDAA